MCAYTHHALNSASEDYTDIQEVPHSDDSEKLRIKIEKAKEFETEDKARARTRYEGLLKAQRSDARRLSHKESSIYSLSSSNGTPKIGCRQVVKGSKLKFRRGITLDSGSHHNVMPRRLVNKKNIRPSEGSRAGMFYTAANKGRIPNEGEVDFKFETIDGHDEEMTFQIAEVNKALAAIADRVDHNCKVVFDKDVKTGIDASYILNTTTNRITKTTRVGNVWVIETITNAEDAGNESFVRRG